MSLATASKNTALDAVSMTYASLHTGDPGDTGINEVTGGSPAYARQAITLDAAAAGARAASTQPTFDIPASTTVTYLGLWDAETDGNYRGSIVLPSETFTLQGVYQLLTAQIDLNAVAA